jgi:DNA-binding phage protein
MKKTKVQERTPSVDYSESLIAEIKNDEKAQFAFLKVSLEENSKAPEVFLKAVESVAKARGFIKIAKKTV